MSADFWAGYVSGAIGIVIGNPLDIIKIRLQAGASRVQASGSIERPTGLLRGAAAPIFGYGALNSLLFVTYNRSLSLLDPSIPDPSKLAGADLSKIWTAGALGGLASWVVSAPSELIKCRAQLTIDGRSSSLAVLKDVWKFGGLRSLYVGGMVTSLRDSIGYGFYFWSYELSKRILLSRQADPFLDATTMDVLVSGGIAGVITWASIYPLDVIKTRIQTRTFSSPGTGETAPLLDRPQAAKGALQTAWSIYRSEGLKAFYRGVGVCSLRAFIVNAVQWYTYEKLMAVLATAH